jgi:hypothetical protein
LEIVELSIKRAVSVALIISTTLLLSACNNLTKIRSGSFKSHNFSVVEDFTGEAPTKLIERFEVRDGDCSTDSHYGSWRNDCNSGRSRTEFQIERIEYSAPFERWYGWSIYFPDDYISNSPYTMPVLGQFRISDIGGNLGSMASLQSFNEINGYYRFMGAEIANPSNLRGKWHRVEVNVRWTKKKDGFFRVYADGERVYSREGIATFPRDVLTVKYGIYRYPDNGLLYPKGYKDPTQVVYFSNIRIADSRKGLLPK